MLYFIHVRIKQRFELLLQQCFEFLLQFVFMFGKLSLYYFCEIYFFFCWKWWCMDVVVVVVTVLILLIFLWLLLFFYYLRFVVVIIVNIWFFRCLQFPFKWVAFLEGSADNLFDSNHILLLQNLLGVVLYIIYRGMVIFLQFIICQYFLTNLLLLLLLALWLLFFILLLLLLNQV